MTTPSPAPAPAPAPLPFHEHLAHHLAPFLPASTLTTIKQTPHSVAAYKEATTHLPPEILAHSIRTFLHAAAHDASAPALLYSTSLLHDLGASPTHACATDQARFEVAGADAAHALLSAHGATTREADAAWRAIALHTSAGIAERMGHPVAALRRGVVADFGGAEDAVRRPFEAVLARGEVEVCLGEAVVRQVAGFGGRGSREVKAPAASWAGVLVAARERDPGFEGVNPAF